MTKRLNWCEVVQKLEAATADEPNAPGLNVEVRELMIARGILTPRDQVVTETHTDRGRPVLRLDDRARKLAAQRSASASRQRGGTFDPAENLVWEAVR